MFMTLSSCSSLAARWDILLRSTIFVSHLSILELYLSLQHICILLCQNYWSNLRAHSFTPSIGSGCASLYIYSLSLHSSQTFSVSQNYLEGFLALRLLDPISRFLIHWVCGGRRTCISTKSPGDSKPVGPGTAL